MENGENEFQKTTFLLCRCGVHMVQMSLQLTGNYENITKEFSWILKIVFWTRLLFHSNQLKNNQYARHVIFCLLLTYINSSQCYTSNVKSHHKHVHICTQIRSERVLTKILH